MPTGAPPSSARWAPARPSSPQPPRTWRASSGFWCWGRPTWPQVETGGGDDGARRPRRHRQVHHRPGAAPPLRRLRPSLRGDEPGEDQALLPLDARRDTAVGCVQGQAVAGRGDGGALQCPLLPHLRRPDRGQGRGAPHRRGPEPQEAHLRRLRLPPLADGQVRPRPLPSGRLREAPHEGLLRPAGRRRGARVQGARRGPGHRRRRPSRRLRQVPQPVRDVDGRLFEYALPPALPVQPGDQDGLRTLRRAPLDTAVRLRGAHRRQARRRLGGGRAVQQAAQVPQGRAGEAGPRALGPLPHHRQHRLPAPRGRGLRAALLRGAGDAVQHGLGGGCDGLLPAQRLQHRVRGAAAEAGGGSQGWLEAAAGDLPANPVGLP